MKRERREYPCTDSLKEIFSWRLLPILVVRLHQLSINQGKITQTAANHIKQRAVPVKNIKVSQLDT